MLVSGRDKLLKKKLWSFNPPNFIQYERLFLILLFVSACCTGWTRCLNTFGCETTISFCRVSGCYVHKTTSFPQTRNIRMRNRPKRPVLVSMAHHFILHAFLDMSCKSMVFVSVADHLFFSANMNVQQSKTISICGTSSPYPPRLETNIFAPWKSMVGSLLLGPGQSLGTNP